ncbi:MAG: hypothetical protein E7620_01845 [Ruminococcaceae bacterium]|nr:hypothetical protein [Oscillospiraceae bacterium]
MNGREVRLKKPFCGYCVTNVSAEYLEENRAWQGAPCIARTTGGRLYLSFMTGGIYEPDPRNYRPHYYSDDNGETWSKPFMVLESDPAKRMRVSDGALWTAPDGTLFIVYDRERNNKVRKSLVTQSSEAAKEILFARVSRGAVESGVLDEETVRARVISKAKINELNNRFVNDN